MATHDAFTVAPSADHWNGFAMLAAFHIHFLGAAMMIVPELVAHGMTGQIRPVEKSSKKELGVQK
ncbi:MAG: hypothetical protein WC050_01415 [Candidatus Paceibacterota bacterium]